MKKIFRLKRDFAIDKTTLGTLIRPDGTLFGYVLEDKVREYGVKIKGETAIPENICGDLYKVGVRVSPKYGEVVVIYTREENGVYYLEAGGISFQFILAHGGNSHKDTEGCLLVNKNRSVENMSAWGSLQSQILKEVKEMIAQGDKVFISIENSFKDA